MTRIAENSQSLLKCETDTPHRLQNLLRHGPRYNQLAVGINRTISRPKPQWPHSLQIFAPSYPTPLANAANFDPGRCPMQ